MDIIINKKPVSVPFMPILALFAVIVLAFMSARIASVQGDEVGVFINNLTGSVTVKLDSGSSVYNGLFTDFYQLKKTERTISMVKSHNDQVRIKTGDGSDIDLDVYVTYKLIPSEKDIAQIVKECGLTKVIPYGAQFNRENPNEEVDAYHETWIRDFSRSIVRHVFGELDPKEFYDAGMRDKKAEDSRTELNQELNQHGIEITKVVPGEYTYYAEYKKLIDDKKAADQEVENQIAEASTAREDQKRQTTEADAKVKAQIAQTKGLLEKEYLAAEAEARKETLGVEAEAYQVRTNAEAQFTRAQNSAKATLALSAAEAEGLKKLAESLSGEGGMNLVKLKYAEVLKTAKISGLPYSTDPRIQKVELDTNGRLGNGGNK